MASMAHHRTETLPPRGESDMARSVYGKSEGDGSGAEDEGEHGGGTGKGRRQRRRGWAVAHILFA